MSSRVAWCPVPGRELVGAASVLSGPSISRGQYLADLGTRLERMIQACEDREEALDLLVRRLRESSLYEGDLPPPSRIGMELVESNPLLWERLHLWGLPGNLRQPIKWMPAAELVLKREREDGIQAIENWTGALRVLP